MACWGFLYIFVCFSVANVKKNYSMNFLFSISFLFSWWVFPYSNCYENTGYLVDCSLFRENSLSEHSLNILIKSKQITSDLSFTYGTTVPELIGNKNLSKFTQEAIWLVWFHLKSCITLLGTMSAVVTVGQKRIYQISIAVQFALCVNLETRNK